MSEQEIDLVESAWEMFSVWGPEAQAECLERAATERERGNFDWEAHWLEIGRLAADFKPTPMGEGMKVDIVALQRELGFV